MRRGIYWVRWDDTGRSGYACPHCAQHGECDILIPGPVMVTAPQVLCGGCDGATEDNGSTWFDRWDSYGPAGYLLSGRA